MAQPTTFLEQASSTIARYKNPAQVAIYVMSATQSLSSSAALGKISPGLLGTISPCW